MKRVRLKKLGPLSYFRIKSKDKNFITVWLTGCDGPFGWEWGTDGEPTNPSICLRVGYFNILSLEQFKVGGFTLWVMGFWWTR